MNIFMYSIDDDIQGKFFIITSCTSLRVQEFTPRPLAPFCPVPNLTFPPLPVLYADGTRLVRDVPVEAPALAARAAVQQREVHVLRPEREQEGKEPLDPVRFPAIDDARTLFVQALQSLEIQKYMYFFES